MSYVPPHLRRHQHSSTGATSHGKKSKRDNRGGSDDGSSGSSHRRGNTTDGRNNRREYNNDDKSSSADNTDELNPNISSSRGSDGRGGSFGGIPPSPLSTSHCHDHDYAPSRSRRAFQDRRTRRRPDIGNTVHRDAALAVRNSQAKRDARRNRFRAAGEVGTATSLSLPSSSLSSPPLPSSLLLSKSRAGVYGTCTSLCVREELSKRKLRQLEQSWTDTPSHTDATKTKDESNTDTKNIDRTADNESDGDNCDNDKRNQRSGEGYSHSDTAHRHHHSQQKRFELHKSCLLHYCPHTHLSPAPTATAIGDVSSIVALKEYQRSSASKLKVHAIRDDPLSTIRPPRVLRLAMDHLLQCVMARCDFSIEEVYSFASDRMRSIKKDLVMQGVTAPSHAPVIYEDAAWVLERMVSFYTVMHWLFLAETPHVSCPTSLSSSSPISYTSPSRSPSKMNSVFDSHLNERLLVDCLETLLNVYTAQRQTKAYANLQKQGGSTRVGKGTNNPDNINDVGGKSDSGGKINEAAVGDERDAKWAERELRFIAVSLLLKLPQPPSQLSSSLQQALVLVKASSTAANAVNAASASITGTADGCAMPPLLAFVLEAYSNYHSPNLVRFLRQVLRCFNAISSSLSSSPSSPSLPSPSSCLQTSASIHKDPLLFLLVSRFASSCQLQLLLHMNRAYMKGRTWLGGDHIVQQLGFFFGARQAVEFAHSLHSFPVQMQAETSSVVPQSQSQSQVQIQSQSQLQSEIQLQAQYCVEEKTPQVSFKIGFNNPARAALLAAKHDSKSLNKSTSSGGTEDIEQEDYEREVRALILLNCVQARRSGDCDVGGEHYGKPTSYETKDGRLLWSFDRIKTRVHSVSGPLPHSLYLASNSGQIEGKKKARDVMNRMSVRQLLISWIQHA